jgi:predicted TIM-barrel fold metal-dependent hydrolase
MNEIVDAHIHVWDANEHLSDEFAGQMRRLFGNQNGKLTQNVETVLEDFEDVVDIGIIQGFRAVRQGTLVPNQWVRDIAAKSTRLFALASIDPAEDDWREQVDEAIEGGNVGFKLLPSYAWFSVTNPDLDYLYENASKHGLPVMLHMSAARAQNAIFKYAHPRQIEDVALSYPDLKIVLAHLCYPWADEAFCLARRFPNMYFDTSAHTGRTRALKAALLSATEFGVLDRIMYGSDAPFHISSVNCLGELRGIWDELRSYGAPFDHEGLKNILGGIAMKLWRLNK